MRGPTRWCPGWISATICISTTSCSPRSPSSSRCCAIDPALAVRPGAAGHQGERAPDARARLRDPALQARGFVLAGTIAGLAGYLAAAKEGYVNPELMAWHQSGTVLMMLILGGMGTLFGAVVGAFSYVLLQEWFSALTKHWQLLDGRLHRRRGAVAAAGPGRRAAPAAAPSRAGAPSATMTEPVLATDRARPPLRRPGGGRRRVACRSRRGRCTR